MGVDLVIYSGAQHVVTLAAGVLYTCAFGDGLQLFDLLDGLGVALFRVISDLSGSGGFFSWGRFLGGLGVSNKRLLEARQRKVVLAAVTLGWVERKAVDLTAELHR